MELPIELKRLIERNKAQYGIEGDEEEILKKIAIVPQKAMLFKGTVRSNLLWGNENATDDEMWRALEIAQASSFVKEKELGLDEPITQGGKNLSGGQKQRLTIARALIKNPEIIIFDDSASALDYATESSLIKALNSLPNAPTKVIVSQRASSLMNADLIIVMDDGEMVGKGSHKDLMISCETYREIYQSQFGVGGDE